MSVTILKRIALVSMILGTVGAQIPGAPIWLQWIGRLSAPLFFYCMAWSLDKTHDKKLYFKRLYFCSVGMAVINLVISVIVQKTGLATTVTSNMFATLFATALFIQVLEYARKHPKKGKRMLLSYLFWQFAFAGLWAVLYELAGVPYALLNLASAAVGSAMTCEGAFLYVLMGTIFYYTKEEKGKMGIAYGILCLVFFVNASLGIWGRMFMLLGSDILVAIMEIMTGLMLWGASFRPLFDIYHMLKNDFQWMMLAALPLILCCNGKKGRGAKYFYYIIYPVQVYVLWFVGTVLMG